MLSQNIFLLNIYNIFRELYYVEWFQQPLNIFEVLVYFSFNFNVLFSPIFSLWFGELAVVLKVSWVECKCVYIHLSDTEHLIFLMYRNYTFDEASCISGLEML